MGLYLMNMTGDDIHQDIKIMLNDKNVSYVLITCNRPKNDGSMAVEMSFEGDLIKIEYLLSSALNQISYSEDS